MMPVPNPAKAFSQPCGCGTPAGEPCPHTPIRCPHHWEYMKHMDGVLDVLAADAPDEQKIGAQRTCEYCGRVEKGELSYRTLIA